MAERYPDIEIYIKRAEPARVIAWLENKFGVLAQREQGNTITCELDDNAGECVIVENAVKGGYTSVWFKTAHTPWQTDRDCAIEAHETFGLEVRCSVGSWSEDSEDTGGWLRITDKGETRVNWL